MQVSRKQPVDVSRIKPVAAVVALFDASDTIGASDEPLFRQDDLAALLHQRAGERCNHRHRRLRIVLGMIGFRQSKDVTSILNNCVLKATATAEKRPSALASKLNRPQSRIGIRIRTRRYTPQPIKAFEIGYRGGVQPDRFDIRAHLKCSINGAMRRYTFAAVANQANADHPHTIARAIRRSLSKGQPAKPPPTAWRHEKQTGTTES